MFVILFDVMLFLLFLSIIVLYKIVTSLEGREMECHSEGSLLGPPLLPKVAGHEQQ